MNLFKSGLLLLLLFIILFKLGSLVVCVFDCWEFGLAGDIGWGWEFISVSEGGAIFGSFISFISFLGLFLFIN